jgi:hypothetical protein
MTKIEQNSTPQFRFNYQPKSNQTTESKPAHARKRNHQKKAAGSGHDWHPEAHLSTEFSTGNSTPNSPAFASP